MNARTLIACACLASPGCDWSLQRMIDQQRCEPGEASELFANGSCAQPRPDGVVRWKTPSQSSPEVSGLLSTGEELPRIPFVPTRATLARGRNRFEIFCAPCHGLLGDGQSQVAENMVLRPPPALFESRIAQLPDGHIFRVISHGYGLMPEYAHALVPGDRWAVVAYVRVLARSQRARLEDLPRALQEEAEPWLR